MTAEMPSSAEIEALFDHFLSHGCPCRFPRFRASVARDLKEVGAPDWDVTDCGMLLTIFDRRVRLIQKTREEFATRGRCEICGAEVVRFGVPLFRDSFLERATITPAGLADVGAAVDGPLPICGRVFLAAPGNPTRDERERIQRAYPRLGPQDWLAYMRALASGEG